MEANLLFTVAVCAACFAKICFNQSYIDAYSGSGLPRMIPALKLTDAAMLKRLQGNHAGYSCQCHLHFLVLACSAIAHDYKSSFDVFVL